MGKLYKLKKWLTVDEVAQRLSIELEEKVTKADVLQLAVDEKLKISVYFPHDWNGKVCDVTTDIEKASKFELITGFDGEAFRLYEYEKCNDYEFIKINTGIRRFKAGVWELKLIGNSKIDLEWELKRVSNLPCVDVFNLSGFYVKNKDGVIIERQSKLEKDLNEKIDNREKEIDYYPCAGLGEIEGAFFVIQTEHLNEFIVSLDNDVPNVNTKLNLDSALYLLGEVIQVVKSKTKKWTQGEIAREILQIRENENRTAQGLEQRKMEEYFSEANKRIK